MDAAVNHLAKYDAMCRAIDAAYVFDEVKVIHDRAMMMQAAMRVAKNTEAEERAYEIRMRAARKCAKLYDASEKVKALPGNQYTGKVNRSENLTGPKTLRELGTNKQEMAEWRKVAAIPDNEFEEAAATKTLPELIARQTPVNNEALLFIGTIRDFERRGYLASTPEHFMATMTDLMKEEVYAIAPRAALWLAAIKRGER